MKTLSQILGFALIASSLAACGNSSNQQAAALAAQQQATANGFQTGAGGCVPLGSALAFTANGAAVNSTTILAGSFPQSSGIGSYGQVTMGGGFNQQGGGIQYQPKVTSSGQLQISVSGQSMVSGVIQLSQAITSQIQASLGGYNNYYNGQTNPQMNPQANPTQLCVTSISLWAIQTVNSSSNQYTQPGQYNPQYQQMGAGMINQAVVYLNLSSGQQVGPIPFY